MRLRLPDAGVAQLRRGLRRRVEDVRPGPRRRAGVERARPRASRPRQGRAAQGQTAIAIARLLTRRTLSQPPCATLQPMAEDPSRDAGAERRESGPVPHRRAHTTARDLERYAALFAGADQGDALERDARPDGDHRATGGDLARRRTPRHLDLPARELRRADDADRAGELGAGAPVRADRGLRRDQGVHPRGDARRGHGPRPRRHHRHHRRPAGDRPGRQDARRPGRRRHRRGADLPGRGAGLLLLRGARRSRSRSTRTGCESTSSRLCSIGSRPRAGARSSSTRCRAFRTRPG